MAALCWIAIKIGKPNIFLCGNDDYGIPRVRNNPIGKPKTLDMDKHAKIRSNLIKLSLRLQQELWLRKEECIKFSLSHAMKDAQILRIKGT